MNPSLRPTIQLIIFICIEVWNLACTGVEKYDTKNTLKRQKKYKAILEQSDQSQHGLLRKMVQHLQLYVK